MLQNDGSDLAPYFCEWAESLRPFRLDEMTGDLFDRESHIGHSFIARQLFAPRLPMYDSRRSSGCHSRSATNQKRAGVSLQAKWLSKRMSEP